MNDLLTKQMEQIVCEEHDMPRARDVTKIDPDEKWNLIPLINQSTGLINLQMNSFNDFIDFGLKKIMDANKEIILQESPKIAIRYTGIRVEKPRLALNNQLVLTPQMCRTGGLTYSGSVLVDIEYINGKDIKTASNVQIARIPIMLQSNRCHLYNATPETFAKYDECPYDPGCYFIIRGTERIVFVQEQAPYNRILVENSGGTISAVVNSSTSLHKTRVELIWDKDKIVFHHNAFKKPIPIFILFRALGITNDQEIMQLIDPLGEVTDQLMASLQQATQIRQDGKPIFTQEEAIKYVESQIGISSITGTEATIEEKAMSNYKGREFLRSMILPHIPSTLSYFYEKAVFISCQVRWLLKATKDPDIFDSRDYFGNKRLELAGELMELLFEDLFKTFNAIVAKSLRQRMRSTKAPDMVHISSAMRGDTITNGIEYAISSGNWNITRFRMNRAGVSQPLGRMSYIQFVSLVTRISSHFERTQKVSGARSLYPSQFGFICPSDTPEGAQCGLIKNFSLTAHVTVWSDPAPTRRIIMDIGCQDLMTLSGEEIAVNYIVMLNGEPVGVVSDPKSFLQDFKECRRGGLIDKFTAIWMSPAKRCIFICSEAGRVCRPLIIVKNNKPLLTEEHIRLAHQSITHPEDKRRITLDTLIELGVIEFVDVNEMLDCLIAFNDSDLKNAGDKVFTHVEIDNAQLLGICAGVIPCPHHNQSPRNTYQCAMGKQAIGPTALNIFNRFDKSTYFLCYPQMPMVQTRTMRLSRYHDLPSGHTAMVAVMSYSGHDIEDALIMNKASLDRGFGRRYYLSKLDLILKNNGEQRDQIVPLSIDPTFERSARQNRAVDEDGLVRPGERVDPGMVYANKFVPTMGGKFKAQRAVYKSRYPVHVHQVAVSFMDNYGKSVKIKTRDCRRPEFGDKFSSRHGQKGVVGMIVEQEDMPFTESGVYPDMIMNPHGFPSRMTVGKMIELISGKAGLFKGKIGNGTPFSSDRVKDLYEDLIEAGYSYSGKEILTSGITGEPMTAYIFFGPIFYQSLKHMVKDKMQARAKGPTVQLTRQPTQGRARDGGMRLGEMERDCLLGHGAASILYERMLLSSDVYEANVCSKCGLVGYDSYCTECKTKEHMKVVRMPYACKLLFQELITMGVTPRIKLSDF